MLHAQHVNQVQKSASPNFYGAILWQLKHIAFRKSNWMAIVPDLSGQKKLVTKEDVSMVNVDLIQKQRAAMK